MISALAQLVAVAACIGVLYVVHLVGVELSGMNLK